MKRVVSACLLFCAAHLIGACTVEGPLNTLNETRPPLPAMEKLVLFEPNVRVVLFTTDGPVVRKPEISAVAARMVAEITERMRGKGIEMVRFKPRAESEKSAEEQLVKLQFAVGRTRTVHTLPATFLNEEPPFPLPTVNRATAYDVPSPTAVIASDISDRYGTNYGMMVNAYDEQTSGEIKALQFFAVLLAGGQAFQPTFTLANFSIVDLRDGKEVWSYTERSGVKDLTTDAGLYETLDNALKDLAEHRNKRQGQAQP